MKHIWIAALSLLTTSCGIYNKYERPELGTVQTDSLYRAEAAPDTTSSIASLGWEELFTDPYLQSLIQRGLKANTDLQTAALRVKEAQAALMSSKLPTCLPCNSTRRAVSPATTAAKRRKPIRWGALPRGKSTSSES